MITFANILDQEQIRSSSSLIWFKTLVTVKNQFFEIKEFKFAISELFSRVRLLSYRTVKRNRLGLHCLSNDPCIRILRINSVNH